MFPEIMYEKTTNGLKSCNKHDVLNEYKFIRRNKIKFRTQCIRKYTFVRLNNFQSIGQDAIV